MSHFTKVDTVEIKDIKAFVKAAAEIGFIKVDTKTMNGYKGNTMKAEVVVRKPGCKYDIGLVKQKSGKLELISDWWGVNQTVSNAANKISQATTKHTIKSKYAKLGFLAKTTVKDGRVILRLSR